ncbi:MAG TPA: tripartite tricarboxylate transporter TctB family protein [Methylomirabilota bacterium]|nr:tripartite tricarboxylate transporter TctB family protein [Methylomirabilota bacterium]
MSVDRDPGAPPGSLLGLRIAGFALLGLGAVAAYGTFQISRAAGYSVVGPAVIPLAVSVMLIGLGLVFVLRTTAIPDRDLFEHARAEEAATHWPSVLLLGALLVAYAFALGPLGYIPATALFLPTGARILGSRHLVRDVVIGLGLALVIYFAFTAMLGLRLPAGVLDPFL